jgi:glutamate-1-semialdehyde 2,1-aminomutase
MRATLEHVLTPAAFEHMIPLAQRFAFGVATQIRATELPWSVTRLGCRAEYTFTPRPPRNGAESYAASDFELERFLHLYALNRGVLLTPFHSMALMCPATTESDIDTHTTIFANAVRELTA